MKNWPYPVPSSELWELCDPNPESDFHKPFALPYGETGISNGFLAIKLQTFVDPDLVADHPAAEARLDSLPWHFHDFAKNEDLLPIAREKWDREWVSLDDRVAAIRKVGAIDAWRPGEETGFERVDSPCLEVGANRALIPVAILQLLLKLPRCQIYPKYHSRKSWFFFRFNGGTGITATLPEKKFKPVFQIWKPDVSVRLPGGLFS